MLQYRPDIDGLRALAVLSVLLFHFDVSVLQGGFVGVDVFFVISGFLITAQIHELLERRKFSLRLFLQRRIRRLLPAGIAVLAATTLVAWWLFLPQTLYEFGRSLRAASIFLSNLFFMDEAGYFAGSSVTQPLLHTWSLSVEEQFYLLFPLVMMLAMAGRTPRPKLFIGVLVAASLALAIYGVAVKPVYAFYLPLTRAWEFGVGSLLALGCFPVLRSAALREGLAAAGLLMVLATMLIYDEQIPFPGLNAIIPCVGTALVIYAGSHGGSQVTRLFSWQPLVFIGLISYSVYLWHWPMRVFGDYYLLSEPDVLRITLSLAVCLLLGWLSWKYIEQPFREKQIMPKDRHLLPLIAASLAGLFVAGQAFYEHDGYPERFPELSAQLASWSYNANSQIEYCERGSGDCLGGAVATGKAPGYAIWGDSHGQAVAKAVSDQAALHGETLLYQVKSGCAPLLGLQIGHQRLTETCARRNRDVLDNLLASDSIRQVILVARWALYVEGPSIELGPSEQGTWSSYINAPGYGENPQGRAQLLEDRLLALIDQLQDAGKAVTLVYPVPELGWNLPAITAQARLFDRPLPVDNRYSLYQQRQQRVFEVLDRVRAQRDGVSAVYPHLALCEDECMISYRGAPIYFDDDHLNALGEQLISPQFAPLFAMP